jgi:RsiW-degrading membrane proteinase PrsW (M82 family)
VSERSAVLIRAAGPILGGAILWLQYFDLKDSLRKEPRRMLVFGFFLGGVAAALATGVYDLLAQFGYAGPSEGPLGQLAYFVGVVGPIEEGAKFAVAWAVLFRTRWFDEPIDGLVYAAAVAIGFASLENALYATQVNWPTQLARAATTPLTHSVFSALWGFGSGHALLVEKRPLRRALWLALPLVAAAGAHGAYDAAVVTLGRPWLASWLVLAVWAFVIAHSRRVVKERAVSPDSLR